VEIVPIKNKIFITMRDQFNFAKYILDNPLLKEEETDPLDMDYSQAAENLDKFIGPEDLQSILQQLKTPNAPHFQELGAEIMDAANSDLMNRYMPAGGNAYGLAKHLVVRRKKVKEPKYAGHRFSKFEKPDTN